MPSDGKYPPLYHDREGFPILGSTWTRLFENFYYKVVKQDTLKNGWRVSTVWIGLDHSFTPGAPMFFETMVFPPEGFDHIENDMARYSDERSAKEGHRRMVHDWSTKAPYIPDPEGKDKQYSGRTQKKS